MANSQIEHVFVLMLENRSFDHLFGFSGISGTDAETGLQTAIDGLSGKEQNSSGGVSYPIARSANYRMQVDPAHELSDVLLQLCGPGAKYAPGGSYPPIDNSGFVASYIEATAKADQRERRGRDHEMLLA